MDYRVYQSDGKSVAVDVDEQRRALSAVGAKLIPADLGTEGDVIENAADADGLIVDARTPVTERVLEALADLRVVGRAGIGVDNVDVEAAACHDVRVVNVPAYCLDEVATHTLSLVLACLRRLPRYDESVRSGHWDWEVGRPIGRLQELTIGMVGFGRIPRRLATMTVGFGWDAIAHDPYLPGNVLRSADVTPVGFDELLESADVVSLHVPLSEETEELLDAEAFAAMKRSAILVNTARGGLVDEEALAEALVDGEIDAAGLDVLAEEPPGESPLFDLENVLLSPHTGWYSESAREELSREVAADVARVLVGEEPESEVTTDRA